MYENWTLHEVKKTINFVKMGIFFLQKMLFGTLKNVMLNKMKYLFFSEQIRLNIIQSYFCSGHKKIIKVLITELI